MEETGMKDTLFSGKKILFIAPVFYNYHTHITEALSKMGAQVTFVPERQYSNFHNLCYKRVCLRNLLQQKYFQRIEKQFLNQPYDYLFVIRGFGMPVEFIQSFREKNPTAKCIMYQWDSEKANPFIHLKELFNWVMTFDIKDAQTYKLKQLHLFYHDGYKRIAESQENKEYDFVYVSFYKKERYEALIDLKEKLKEFRFFHFMYLPLRSYIKLRLSGCSIRRDLVSFKTMKEEDLLGLLAKTRCVIDITPKIQTGMPIRIMEALGAQLPVLTNNEYAQNCWGKKSFIQGLSETTDFKSFLQNALNDSFKCFENYSIEAWLCNVFTNTGSDTIDERIKQTKTPIIEYNKSPNILERTMESLCGIGV